VNALIYVLVVTMQLGGIVGGHIVTVTLPGQVSALECSAGSGYVAEAVASSPRIRAMRREGWRIARWDCQRDVFARLKP